MKKFRIVYSIPMDPCVQEILGRQELPFGAETNSPELAADLYRGFEDQRREHGSTIEIYRDWKKVDPEQVFPETTER